MAPKTLSFPQPEMAAQPGFQCGSRASLWCSLQRLSLLFVTLSLLLASASLPAQEYKGKTIVVPRLVADTASIAPGKTFTVGLELAMEPGWHTYWLYGGDAGDATKIEWSLPEGFQAGPIEWPLPEKIVSSGDIENYGYEHKVLLLTQIQAPENLPSGQEITLKAAARWLVCEEICIPGQADLTLSMPVASATEPANAELFKIWRSRLPKPISDQPGAAVTWIREKEKFVARVSGLPGIVDFFPLPHSSVVLGHPAVKSLGADVVEITIPFFEAPESVKEIGGVLVQGTNENAAGWQLPTPSAPDTKNPKTAATPSATTDQPTHIPPAPLTAAQVMFALLGGFLGGLILNIMPCVFPVLSLKIYGFMQQADADRSKVFQLGLAFAAGIFTWFLGLAAFAIAVKSAGGDPAWAQQFQNPYFTILLLSLTLLFALNLFGVFEILLPGRTENALAAASSHSGFAGAYAQGLFATILGTACTAPVIGGALTVALSQPAPITLGMFSSIAAGMSLPYLLLSAFPGWMQFLPRPGAWMVQFKQFVGLLLVAIIPWLLFVLATQRGPEGVAWGSAFLFTVALAAWIYGSFVRPGLSPKTRTAGLMAALLVLALGGGYFLGVEFRQTKAGAVAVHSQGGIPWEPFSQESLAKALETDRPVFLDFTAAWCVSCKINERLVLETDPIREAFRKYNVLPIKADWTNGDPEITRLLKQFNRVGVPLYVIYPAANRNEPIVLPELLTHSIVLDALQKAALPSTTLSNAAPAVAESHPQ